MAMDVIVFAVLVLVAPFYTLFHFLSIQISELWWLKFSLGIITGLATMITVSTLLWRVLI